MIILTASELEMAFGENIIFTGVSFEIGNEDKMGLVGVNGTGKTTLFKLINRELSAEKGTIAKNTDTKIGYMEQHVVADSETMMYTETLEVFRHLMDIEQQLDDINNEIDGGNHSEEIMHKQMELRVKYEDMGGLTYRARTESCLIGLGFAPSDLQKPVSVLSGGEKAKVQLAKLLLSDSNLLLLDEPTNHLDINAVEWLEKFLCEYRYAYIIISHDRFFLDKVTNKTMEIENKRLTCYKGNYTRFLALKKEHNDYIEKEYKKTTEEIARIEAIIEQQKRWNQARNYIIIANKQKSIDRLKATLVVPEKPPEELRFAFRAKEECGNDVLMAKNLGVSFDGKSLFSEVDLDIKRKERVFLLGSNGSGKTSLFRILTEQINADEGSFKLGARVRIGYFDQIQTGLDDSKTVMDELWDAFPKFSPTEVRTALGSFLFRGDEVFRLVGKLSGGEKARLSLLKLMLGGANLLLLDEPTNHLDIASREALEAALLSYDGTLFIISHDRYLINRLADRIYYLNERGIKEYKGNYDYYLENRAVESAVIRKEEQPKEKVSNYKLQKERESEKRKLATRITRLEAEIEALESEISQTNDMLLLPEIASDYEKISELTEKINTAQTRLSTAMDEWAECGEKQLELE